jgi:lipoate-protein ligase B
MIDRHGYIIDLGLIEYKKAWDIQRSLWARRVDDLLPDVFLLLEHPHVITLGRRGNRTHLHATESILKSMGVSLYHVERGGDVTYHGPGQIVGYPILSLRGYGYRVIQYVDQLEEVIIRVLADFGIEGRRDSLNRGVWVEGDKIASIGVAIKRFVSFHGFALNYETDLKYFDLMNPCGLEGKKITSMKKLLGREIPRASLVETILVHFREIFKGDWMEKPMKDLLEIADLGLQIENSNLTAQI